MIVKLKAEHRNITLKIKTFITQNDTNLKPMNINTGSKYKIIIIYRLISLCNWLHVEI